MQLFYFILIHFILFCFCINFSFTAGFFFCDFWSNNKQLMKAKEKKEKQSIFYVNLGFSYIIYHNKYNCQEIKI